jgi:hypothetical protein
MCCVPDKSDGKMCQVPHGILARIVHFVKRGIHEKKELAESASLGKFAGILLIDKLIYAFRMKKKM